MRLDLTSSQALRGERDHHRVDALEAPLALPHRLGFESPGPAPRDIDRDRPDLGAHRLGNGSRFASSPTRPLLFLAFLILGSRSSPPPTPSPLPPLFFLPPSLPLPPPPTSY